VLVLLLGLLQVGIVVQDQILVAAAAREGAREAAVTPDEDLIVASARRAAPGLDLKVDISRGERRGDPAQVAITTHPRGLPLVGRIASVTQLKSSATMRVEREG
jgi:hypothetical protein